MIYLTGLLLSAVWKILDAQKLIDISKIFTKSSATMSIMCGFDPEI